MTEPSLKDTVKAWRNRQGVTTREAAALLEVPQKTLQHIIDGRSFRYEKMLRMAIKALDT